MTEPAAGLWRFSQLLAQGRFEAACRLAQDIFDQMQLPELLALVTPGYVECLQLTTGHTHLGFLLTPEAESEFLAAAAHQGWRSGTRFRSQIAARELAQLSGQEELPTHICKLTGPAGRSLEAFLPQSSRETIESWTREGIVTHFGIELHDQSCLEKVLQWSRSGPFQVPAFLGGSWARNVQEDILVLYLDGQQAGVPLRLEFYRSPAGP